MAAASDLNGNAVDAVVDACSCAATDRDEAVAFFSRSTRNLLEAERQTTVQHHVLLSIAGLRRIMRGSGSRR